MYPITAITNLESQNNTILPSHSFGVRIQHGPTGSTAQTLTCQIKVLTVLYSFLEALGIDLPPSSFRLLVKFSFFVLLN